MIDRLLKASPQFLQKRINELNTRKDFIDYELAAIKYVISRHQSAAYIQSLKPREMKKNANVPKKIKPNEKINQASD